MDPWGKILCEIPEEVGVAVAEIDMNKLEEIRKSMPVENHRRTDVYQLTSDTDTDHMDCSGILLILVCSVICVSHIVVRSNNNCISESLDDQEWYNFGHVKVPSSAVFYRTNLSFAFVNKKPVLPGRILHM